MFLYCVLTIPVAIAGGILLARRTQKGPEVIYGPLDKLGRVTNIVLIPLYAIAVPFALFLGMVSAPNHSGLLGLLGWAAAVIIASPALFAGFGLGASAALRKKGKSKASFAVQFAGAVGVALSFGLYSLLEGSLLRYLN